MEREAEAFTGGELASGEVVGHEGLVAEPLGIMIENEAPGGRLSVGAGLDQVAFGSFMAAEFGQGFSIPNLSLLPCTLERNSSMLLTS